MKKLFGSLLVVAVVVAILLALRQTHHTPAPDVSEDNPTPQTQTSSQTNAALRAANTPTQSAQPTGQPAVAPAQNPFNTAPPTPEQRAETLRQALEQKNVPIDFYGRVIDQDSNSVSGASVKVYIRHWKLTDDAVSEPIRTDKITDADGRFEIHGVTGDAVDIEAMQKPGYELSPKFSHSAGPASGSADNPVVYQMWKTGEKAQLVSGNKFWGIVPDGRPYTIDLLLGTKSESGTASGDLRVAVSRPPNVSRKDLYDWSFKITPIDGGILETTDEFMYQAPDNGYAPEYEFQLKASDTNWTHRVKKDFYVRSRGRYGRINVEVIARYQNEGVFSVGYAVNPAGSRNLQP